jgi:hypothetical protein
MFASIDQTIIANGGFQVRRLGPCITDAGLVDHFFGRFDRLTVDQPNGFISRHVKDHRPRSPQPRDDAFAIGTWRRVVHDTIGGLGD